MFKNKKDENPSYYDEEIVRRSDKGDGLFLQDLDAYHNACVTHWRDGKGFVVYPAGYKRGQIGSFSRHSKTHITQTFSCFLLSFSTASIWNYVSSGLSAMETSSLGVSAIFLTLTVLMCCGSAVPLC